LYTTAGVEHPGARRAVPQRARRFSSRVERDRELFGFNQSSDSDGLGSNFIYRNVFIVTLFFGLIEAFFKHRIGLITTIPFALISIASAFRVSYKNAWAAWTAPPLVFAFVAMATSPISGQSLGKFPIGLITGLVLVLMANTWAVLGTTGACWFLARRIVVKHNKQVRRERRAHADIETV
jgi:hypothetical protein